MDSGKIIKANESFVTLGNGYPPSPYSSLPYQSHEPGLLDYWHILKKRRNMLFLCLAGAVLLAALITYHTTTLYQSVGRVAIYREDNPVLNFKDSATLNTDDWDYTVALETQVRILQSDALALKVMRDLAAGKKPNTDPSDSLSLPDATSMPLTGEKPVSIQEESALIGQLKGNLQVSTIPNTRMIELRYSNPDPPVAAKTLNLLMDDFIQENIRTRYDSTVQASQWLSKQLTDLQLKVETSQEKLVMYEKANDILGLDEKQNIITSKLDDLNRELTQAQADRMQKEAAHRMASSESPELVSKADPNSMMEQLRFREADLRSQYAQLSTQYGPSYPKVAEVANQLKSVEQSIQGESKRIAGHVRTEYLGALQREQLLKNALEQQKQEANKLNERAIQYALLKRDLDTNQQLYENVLQKLKEAGVAAALKSSNIRIVDPARVPIAPSKPDVMHNLAVGVLFGLMFGLVAAFAAEAFDGTVRTPEQVHLITSLPSLGVVPMALSVQPAVQIGNGNGNKSSRGMRTSSLMKQRIELISHSHPKSQIAESYRALRTSILLSSLGPPPQVILVTSALPQEGKTTTSLNCAIVLAQQGGRVLLVDADLRRPGIQSSLGIKQTTGLSNLLTGKNKLEEVMVRSPQVTNLYVLPAGPTPPHPAELLASPLMRDFLQSWREKFDHIVLDTPPALSVTDAVALSVLADSVILVIRSGSTSKQALRRARDLLLRVNAKVTGVVVNAVDLRAPDLHYYYYSGAKYGSYYYEETAFHK